MSHKFHVTEMVKAQTKIDIDDFKIKDLKKSVKNMSKDLRINSEALHKEIEIREEKEARLRAEKDSLEVRIQEEKEEK